MPIITVECVAMSRETKEKFIQEITAKASEITNIRSEAFTIIFHENGSDNFGVGGKILSEIMNQK